MNMDARQRLRVLLIDDAPGRAALLQRALEDAGYMVAARIDSSDGLLKRVLDLQPDVIIVDLESPDRDTLENLSAVNRALPRPIVMFAEDEQSGAIHAAIRAGVSAYVVEGVSQTRVRPLLDVAVARFREYHALRDELEKTRESLAERKLVDKAKGLLMKQRGCNEEDAYQLLRKVAMNNGQRISDVAKNLISAAELLG
jgi:response regulator NasT